MLFRSVYGKRKIIEYQPGFNSIHTNAYVQKAGTSSNIPGNAVNSNLTITDHRYRQDEFDDTIIGTIVNNSTPDISFASVYVALYYKDKLIQNQFNH